MCFHGCLQSRQKLGREFALNSGYNQVADSNNMIILYPQIKGDRLTNPYDCWDWIGYSDQYFGNLTFN